MNTMHKRSIRIESMKTSRSNLWTVLSVLIVSLFLLNSRSFAQGVGISESSITPDASAILELRSTARGFLPSRLTTGERDGIGSPATGLFLYNTTTNRFNYRNGSWIALVSASDDLSALSSSTSLQLSTLLSDETGSGPAVFATSPAFTTPNIGVATATSLNKVAITAPATSATLTIADGKTLTASNTLTLTGTDGSSVAFGTGGTATYTSNNLGVFSSTTSAQLGVVLSDETGSGAAVFSTSPSLTTPNIGAAAATSINNIALTDPGTAATLTLANNSTLATTGAFSTTITSTAATTVTLPTTGTLAVVPVVAQLTGDVATTSTTLTDVTGLASFSLDASSTYYFKFRSMVTSSAAGVGILQSVNASGAVTSINYIHQYPTSATAIVLQQVTALQGGTLPASGMGATLTEYIIEGTVTTSSAVTLALQQRSETGGTVTTKAGSFGFVQKLQ